MYLVATFYLFVHLENYYDMRFPILDFCNHIGMKGTILLAEEGLNATISGSKSAIQEFFGFMKSDERFVNLSWRLSASTHQPFQKMKVKLRKELVNIGINNLDSDNIGEYLGIDEWKVAIEDDEFLIIDTRNSYESEIGTFKNAIVPNTETFREFPMWVDKNLINISKDTRIGMFCTGGIRCEKSTAYLKNKGFKNVYHLKGGILNYLEKTGNHDKRWHGKCFVFDDRVAVDDEMRPCDDMQCKSCGVIVSSDQLKKITRGNVLCDSCIA